MSSAIPKEQQSAYERWELASFGDERSSAKAAAQAAANELALQQIAAMREQARQEGYATGYAEGRAAGLEMGRTDAAREIAPLHQIAAAFGDEVARANESMAEDMLNLALDLAKALLKTSLAIRPELVLPVVGEAIRYLPSVQQPAILFLHPQDAAIVRDHMGDDLAKAGWRVADDAQLARGGCRVETASNQIDATITTRWQRIAEALGKQADWLDA
ncbi:MAG TPA: flagellar assembly protein FliH [Paucimonas sp.]|nr:flagellar assembly protein FliH [Paucimonas sp.]HJW55722.1 flagellar assembly protein FliH [Burkholderiaceae bacterium]